MPIDPEAFRQALGRFPTGVTIVTSRNGDEVHGTTMNAFCSVSLDPPLILVSVEKSADSHGVIGAGGVFAVNILKADQSDLSTTLSRKGEPFLDAAHRLEGIPYTTKVTGSPILPNTQAYLDCVLTQAIDAGDHTIYIGRIEDAGWDDSVQPLVYYRGQYGGFTAEP